MFADILNEYESMKKEFTLKIKDAMLVEFKEFFDKNPDVKTIQWTQYAPYFNDGEPCTFSVHCVTFSNLEPDYLSQWGDIEDEPEEDIEGWAWSGYGKLPAGVNTSALKELYDLLNRDTIEEFLQDTFGSDALVVVTRDGIEIRDCNHD